MNQAEIKLKKKSVLKEINALKLCCHENIMIKDYQWTPLKWIFDIKKEDMCHRTRFVVLGHAFDALCTPEYSSAEKYLYLPSHSCSQGQQPKISKTHKMLA